MCQYHKFHWFHQPTRARLCIGSHIVRPLSNYPHSSNQKTRSCWSKEGSRFKLLVKLNIREKCLIISEVNLVKDALPSACWMIVVDSSLGLSEINNFVLAQWPPQEPPIVKVVRNKTCTDGYYNEFISHSYIFFATVFFMQIMWYSRRYPICKNWMEQFIMILMIVFCCKKLEISFSLGM